MILLFTDFGWSGPYIGQMRSATLNYANSVPVVDLMHDAPKHDPKASSYLLAALAPQMPKGCCCVGVVDPGVGTDRDSLILKADGRFFIGPDNGLFSIVARRSETAEWFRISWRPEVLSASFHGRDLFAPVGAMIAQRMMNGEAWMDGLAEPTAGGSLMSQQMAKHMPDDVPEVIYIDGFGNCILGLRAATMKADAIVDVNGTKLYQARTFGNRSVGEAFWYENSMQLVEIAVNRGNAAAQFGLQPGDTVSLE